MDKEFTRNLDKGLARMKEEKKKLEMHGNNLRQENDQNFVTMAGKE